MAPCFSSGYGSLDMMRRALPACRSPFLSIGTSLRHRSWYAGASPGRARSHQRAWCDISARISRRRSAMRRPGEQARARRCGLSGNCQRSDHRGGRSCCSCSHHRHASLPCTESCCRSRRCSQSALRPAQRAPEILMALHVAAGTSQQYN